MISIKRTIYSKIFSGVSICMSVGLISYFSSNGIAGIKEISESESQQLIGGACPGYQIGEQQAGYCSSVTHTFKCPNLKAVVRGCKKDEECPFKYWPDLSLPDGEIFQWSERPCTTPCGGYCGYELYEYFDCHDGIPNYPNGED